MSNSDKQDTKGIEVGGRKSGPVNQTAQGENGSRMYAETQTWNPFKGCRFECTYCGPSFRKQSKRQKRICDECYRYAPHCHEERLKSIPAANTIFVAGNADISFCPPEFTRKIISRIKLHNERCPDKTFYFQSKQPGHFAQFLSEFPPNVILLTTLETNRDAGYGDVAKAPLPSERYRQFRALDYSRKVVTIEPVMDFDQDDFSRWILDLKPEYVWLGYNSRPEQISLPEPSEAKLRTFVKSLVDGKILIKGKDLRGIDLGIPQETP